MNHIFVCDMRIEAWVDNCGLGYGVNCTIRIEDLQAYMMGCVVATTASTPGFTRMVVEGHFRSH